MIDSGPSILFFNFSFSVSIWFYYPAIIVRLTPRSLPVYLVDQAIASKATIVYFQLNFVHIIVKIADNMYRETNLVVTMFLEYQC